MPRRMPHPSAAAGSPLRVSHWSTVTLALGAIAMVAVAAVVADAVSSLFWWLTVAVLAGSWWVARRHTRGVAETAAENLDERDLATRNVAAWWGQTVMFTLGAVTALLLLIAARLDAASANAVLQRCGGIVLSFVLLSTAVPTFVVSLIKGAEEESASDDPEFDA